MPNQYMLHYLAICPSFWAGRVTQHESGIAPLHCRLTEARTRSCNVLYSSLRPVCCSGACSLFCLVSGQLILPPQFCPLNSLCKLDRAVSRPPSTGLPCCGQARAWLSFDSTVNPRYLLSLASCLFPRGGRLGLRASCRGWAASASISLKTAAASACCGAVPPLGSARGRRLGRTAQLASVAKASGPAGSPEVTEAGGAAGRLPAATGGPPAPQLRRAPRAPASVL